MSYRNPYNMSLRLLLLLMMLYEACTLPALETAPPATAVNSIEETDKLPDTHVEPIASNEAALTSASSSNQTSAGNNEPQEPSVPGDNVASASSNEPVSIYAGGLITPEAFQQYLSQFGGAAGLQPLAAGYPAPLTGAAGIYPYPGPIMVQTGYEGFLVPANQVSPDVASDSTTTVAATPSPGMNPLIAFASRLLPSILMSTLFRIVAVVLSAVGVILFGTAITSTLCRHTQICEFPNKAVNYLRFGGAQDVGRMIAEEITPERVRRTTEFVRKAIHKYRQLQKLVEPESD
ncbi:hypothetical protein AWZ03_005434 [Drosophila navojoa]|uniref:CG10035-PA n=1 Tax=Drosophila navojoa TaxID=7232 RepID=A0A484BHK3_DRONA|nr:uncharacterized protein LOC115562308 [Drosophila navojoa]TDG48259.1 hypothetical protein AWZ03_005434 [Drosophila navojoa]